MLKCFEKLTAKVMRADRRHKRDMFRKQLAALVSLCEALAQAKTGIDPKIVAWLQARLKSWKMEERFLTVAAWVGAPQARFLLKYAGKGPDDIAPLMDQWLDRKAGMYDFGGLKLPLPASKIDEGWWPHFFENMIIYHLLDGFDAQLIFKMFAESEGPYELNDRFRIRENDVVFDCGANIGSFSALAVMRGGQVYAFEPSRHIRETYLEKTAALNRSITVCPYALSDSPGILEFIIDYDNIGGSRINQPGVKKDTDDKIEIVEALRLDDFVAEHRIEGVDFIKADIEGAERKMLAGATRVMKTLAPKLSICTYHLPDDPEVLSNIILSAQPRYKIIQGPHKLYAYVE